jgi:hypothetical protein
MNTRSGYWWTTPLCVKKPDIYVDVNGLICPNAYILIPSAPCRKEDEMNRACSTHGEERNAYKILVGKPEGRRILRRQRRRRNNIKMDIIAGGHAVAGLRPDKANF